MALMDPVIREMEVEARTTRRVLERVPADKFDWKPHTKSMSLAELAMHVATIPSFWAEWLATEFIDRANFKFQQPVPKVTADIVAEHEKSQAAINKFLAGIDEKQAAHVWRFVRDGKDLLALPRGVAVRSLMCNHLYHHRGQLTVYRRLLDVPVPMIYGPSADENPFR